MARWHPPRPTFRALEAFMRCPEGGAPVRSHGTHACTPAENPRPPHIRPLMIFFGGHLPPYDPYMSEKPFSRAFRTYFTYPLYHLFATQKRLSAEHWFHAFKVVAVFLGSFGYLLGSGCWKFTWHTVPVAGSVRMRWCDSSKPTFGFGGHQKLRNGLPRQGVGTLLGLGTSGSGGPGQGPG